jgi:protein SERAC1
MAAGRKFTVFRATGLTRDQLDEDLETSLRVAIDENLSEEEKSQIETKVTVLPSCYEGDRERVALVQFRGGVPHFLSELRDNHLRDWQIEMGDTDVNFDCHFFGFTQLYALAEPVIAE